MQCFPEELFDHQKPETFVGQVSASSALGVANFVLENRAAKAQHTCSAITSFIHRSFATAYGADIHSFLPVLVALEKNNQLCSAIGVRCNSETLFLDQYLPCPAASFLMRKNIASPPLKLAEIGNLCSRSRRYTLPMLTLIISALFLQQTDYVLFTANAPVRKLLKQYGLPLIELIEADQKALHASQESWGSYYDTTPKVMALSVPKAMARALKHDRLQTLLRQEAATLNHLVTLLGGKQS